MSEFGRLCSIIIALQLTEDTFPVPCSPDLADLVICCTCCLTFWSLGNCSLQTHMLRGCSFIQQDFQDTHPRLPSPSICIKFVLPFLKGFPRLQALAFTTGELNSFSSPPVLPTFNKFLQELGNRALAQHAQGPDFDSQHHKVNTNPSILLSTDYVLGYRNRAGNEADVVPSFLTFSLCVVFCFWIF